MKTWDVAIKDLLRAFRSLGLLAFMFLLPLLTTGVIYFAFGGAGSGDEGLNVPATAVQVANLDAPTAQPGFAAGRLLLEFLQSEELAGLLQVTVAADEAAARSAVESGEAGVAVIIPAGFTDAAFAPQGSAAITLYHDPTLTLGPALMRGLLGQFVDGFSGAIIAARVTAGQLAAAGVAVDEATMQAVSTAYGEWAQGNSAAVAVQRPATGSPAPADEVALVMGSVMAGMMIFYAFFTGAASAQSILKEHEEGTLARLFTTPTPHSAILGGKFVAVFLTLLVQVAVLLAASSLLFRIRWGDPLPVLLSGVGLVAAAAGFGVMLMSFVRNNRQAGPVMGGALTVTGMAGGLMTTGFTNAPAFFGAISLLLPQGWCLRCWKMSLAGAGAGDLLLPALVTLGWGVVLFTVGVVIFRRRFA